MNIFSKAITFLIIYSGLYFGIELANWTFLIFLFGTNETILQNMELAFWAYLITNIVEYLVIKRKRQERNFWYSRLFSNVLVPWLVVIIWSVLPGIAGTLGPVWFETSWNVFVAFITGLFVIIIERVKYKFSFSFRVVIVVLFLVSLFFFITISSGNQNLYIFKIS
ncbi:MAG: hypothetical protein H0Z22_03675 [Thermosipho sp. (in: Bacteria)]|nr:hypothetical protein [Thermosipho sp. (in: thermotogales)]